MRVLTVLLAAFLMGSLLSAPSGAMQADAVIAKKCKKGKKGKKCRAKKKKKAPQLKDGTYQLTEDRGDGTIVPLEDDKAVISGKGTKISLPGLTAFRFSSVGGDCQKTKVPYGGPYKLVKDPNVANTVGFTADNIPVGPIPEDGTGGGVARVINATINVKTGEYSINFGLRMKNANGAESCSDGGRAEGKF